MISVGGSRSLVGPDLIARKSGQMIVLLMLTLSTLGRADSPPKGSRLSVEIPRSLHRQEGYDHLKALFGFPRHNGMQSLAEYVYYTDSDLCDPNVDKTRGYPERETDKSGKMMPWRAPFILLVDRGRCSFVQKVRNAQHAGAAGVLIADNTCLCWDQECHKNKGGSCETILPIMADDGSGADISIPSFFMFKMEADALKAQLKSNRAALLKMTWSIQNNPEDRVEYNLWMSPASDHDYKEFWSNFQPIAEALGNRAYFTPHMHIMDGSRFYCQGNGGENYCYNLCTNNGRYCATGPNNDLDHNILGANIVRESLRRMCIWNHYGAEDGIGKVYWNYVREFMDRCSSPDDFANEDCVKDAYKHAKVDGSIMNRCMKDSGGSEKDAPNAFLDIEIESKARSGVIKYPFLTVNGVPVDVSLTASNVFQEICNAYNPDQIPEICSLCSRDRDPVACVKSEHTSPPASKSGNDGGKKKMRRFMSFLLVICGFLLLGAVGTHFKTDLIDWWEQQKNDDESAYMPLRG